MIFNFCKYKKVSTILEKKSSKRLIQYSMIIEHTVTFHDHRNVSCVLIVKRHVNFHLSLLHHSILFNPEQKALLRFSILNVRDRVRNCMHVEETIPALFFHDCTRLATKFEILFKMRDTHLQPVNE